MHSSELDSVQAEKADAIRRYNRNRIFVFCLRLIGALALVCSTVTYFSVLKEISSFYLSVLNQKVYVFVLVKALVFIIYLFSTIANSTNDIAAAPAPAPDRYDQYVSLSSTSFHREKVADEEKQLVVSPAPVILEDESSFSNKQIVACESANSALVKRNPVRDLTVSETYKANADQETRFRRTQSEKYKVVRKKKIRRRALQRSETANGRELVVAGGESPARKSMHEMNSEEFRLTIERFIASKKKTLMDENIAFLKEERETEESFTAIAYR